MEQAAVRRALPATPWKPYRPATPIPRRQRSKRSRRVYQNVPAQVYEPVYEVIRDARPRSEIAQSKRHLGLQAPTVIY